MNCPHCAATSTRERTKKTILGYATFFCPNCQHIFNERTGTPFNALEFPPDVVLLAVLWRLRYKLSLRDVAEMFLARGVTFTHETVRAREARFAPLIAEQLRAKRRGQAGTSWHVDEASLKVHGKWCYLYQAIDHNGNVVDSMLSEKRNMAAAKRFFQQVVAVVGHVPDQVTTDGHTSYPRAIREMMGHDVLHRTNKYLNNRLEQDHRGIKQRYYPIRGFGTVEAAARFVALSMSCATILVVLQKPEEERQGRSFAILLLCLDGHSEQFCDERRLPQAVSFAHSLHLPFPHHMYDFISLQCSPSRLERKEAHAWFDESFDEAMVLFDQVVEIFALSEFTRYGKRPFHSQKALGYAAFLSTVITRGVMV